MIIKVSKYSINIVRACSVVAILAVFIFFRWYKLQDTLLFYNDMGRDFIVLLNWSESGKPPLLGPQTSVVSYNQSAWYYYILFPLFLVTNHSALSSTATITLFGACTYVLLLWLDHTKGANFWFLTIVFLLLAVHPQVVLQNRFVWNPSFIPYFLIAAIMAVLKLKKIFSRKWAVLYWISVVFAVGFSYSAVPFVVCLSLYLLYQNRGSWRYHSSIAIVSAGVMLLPLVAFEARHSFALTKLFFEGQTTPQVVTDFITKSLALTTLLFPTSTQNMSIVLCGITLLLVTAGVYFALKTKYAKLPQLQLLLTFLIINTAFFLIVPINPEKHYIFPLLVLLFATVASLPKYFSVAITVIFCLLWTQPYFLNLHTSKPARSITDMSTCYRNFCQNFKKPTYVSMESGILSGYHNALEHQFFLREAGCTAYNIVDHQDQADTMLVIGDNATYTQGISSYYELTLFGPATQSAEFSCTENLKIYQLDRI